MLDYYIQTYGRRLYGLCLTLCTNRMDAEDLYQDTWLKVLRHIDRYDASQPFEPWVTKICVNTYRSSLRRLLHSPIFTGFATDEEQRLVLENAAAPEPEDHADLHAAIDELPRKLRLAVICYYFQDMDVQTVAVTLSIPPGTVKSRLSKARKLLKEALQDEWKL